MQMILCDSSSSNRPWGEREQCLIELYRAFCLLPDSLSSLNYFIGVLNFWTLIEFDCSLLSFVVIVVFLLFIGSLAEICEKCYCDNFQMVPVVVSSAGETQKNAKRLAERFMWKAETLMEIMQHFFNAILIEKRIRKRFFVVGVWSIFNQKPDTINLSNSMIPPRRSSD